MSYVGSTLDDRELREYVLSELRCAALRARLAACDIDSIGIALRGGMIGSRDALDALADVDALDYLEPTPPGGAA